YCLFPQLQLFNRNLDGSLVLGGKYIEKFKGTHAQFSTTGNWSSLDCTQVANLPDPWGDGGWGTKALSASEIVVDPTNSYAWISSQFMTQMFRLDLNGPFDATS